MKANRYFSGKSWNTFHIPGIYSQMHTENKNFLRFVLKSIKEHSRFVLTNFRSDAYNTSVFSGSFSVFGGHYKNLILKMKG